MNSMGAETSTLSFTGGTRTYQRAMNGRPVLQCTAAKPGCIADRDCNALWRRGTYSPTTPLAGFTEGTLIIVAAFPATVASQNHPFTTDTSVTYLNYLDGKAYDCFGAEAS